MSARLELLDPYPAWHGASFRGTLDGTPVLVLLGPEGAGSDALMRAAEAAAAVGALSATQQGVLRLLSVEQVDHRIAWVYPDVSGLGLARLVGSDGLTRLPVRAAAEVVSQVAEVLLGLGAEGHEHPGPEPHDLLLDPSAHVQLAGFTGPFAPSPNNRAPGPDGEAALVYRLGVLLVHLLAGHAPTAGSDRDAHDAMIRRSLIQTMSRPGAVISDRFADWMRGMLAWEPSARPPLSRIPEGLTQVAVGTGGPSLEEWVGKHLLRLIEEAGRKPSSTPHMVPPTSRRMVHHAQVEFDPDLLEDDPTLESSGPIPAPRWGRSMPTSKAPKSTIPVSVGPPPAAVQKPRLPQGFLDPGESEDTDAGATSTAPGRDRRQMLVLALVAASLLVGIWFLVSYLLS